MDFENLIFKNGYIDFSSTKVDTLKKAVLFKIQWEYKTILDEYLAINPLSSEKSFIQYIGINQQKEIDNIEPDVDFFFNPDQCTIEDIDVFSQRNEYWKLKLYQQFLKKRLAYIEELQIKESTAPEEIQTEKLKPEQEPIKGEKLNDNNSIRNKIESAFSFMLQNDPRSHKQILTESDFEKLIDWLTLYFEKSFAIPEIPEPIKKINTAKGNVVFSFKSFYKEEFPNSTFPHSLFELIKSCFYQYRNDDIENMKKTKEPANYKNLFKQRK